MYELFNWTAGFEKETGILIDKTADPLVYSTDSYEDMRAYIIENIIYKITENDSWEIMDSEMTFAPGNTSEYGFGWRSPVTRFLDKAHVNKARVFYGLDPI